MKNFKNLLLVIIVFLQFNAHLFSQDVTPPTAVCFNGVAQTNLPYTGYVVLPAMYFNHNSFDNLTTVDNLKYSFSENINETSKVFCGEGEIEEVNIFIWDEAGNYSNCLSKIQCFSMEGNSCCECYGDKTPPVVTCKQNLKFEILENGSTKDIWWFDFIDDVYDNESGFSNAQFKNGQSTIKYGCSELGENTIDIVAFDKALNSDTCISIINITDPNDYCFALSKHKIDQTLSLSIQPNPASTEAIIQNADQFKFIQIINANGEIINKYDRLTSNFSINTTQLPNGVYYIQAGNEGKLTISKKLVVAH